MSHISVLLHETVDGVLAGRDTGIYVDATFGRGGHTKLLLSKLDQNARVYAFDKDPQALEVAAQLEQEDPRFKIIHASFADIQAELARIGITEVDGIMADLGVSSPQLDQAERGFSFMQDGPLDMRMDNSQGPTAAQWLLEIEEDKEMKEMMQEEIKELEPSLAPMEEEFALSPHREVARRGWAAEEKKIDSYIDHNLGP